MSVPSPRNIVIILAFVAVCALAAAGWMRKTDRPMESAYQLPQAIPYSTPVSSQIPAANQYPDPQTAPMQSDYNSDGYYPSRMRPILIRRQETVQEVQQAPSRVYQEREYYTDSRGHRRGRTKTHSVEIVAGSAAVGAAIGAIAGGGKGAGIGALSGGGAGFVYDRITHNH